MGTAARVTAAVPTRLTGNQAPGSAGGSELAVLDRLLEGRLDLLVRRDDVTSFVLLKPAR